jgi:shikimate dehydrogenase
MQIIEFVKGKSNKTCLIGNPIAHSISPEIHNTLNRELNINDVYIAFKIDNGDFSDALKGIITLGFKGFNITVPYKNKIIEYLHEIDEEALFLGSVNTVNIKNNMLYGYSTDGDGFLKSFKLETGTNFKNKNVTLLGSGGTTRAIAGKLVFEGVKSISIFNRTFGKAEELALLVNNYSKTDTTKAFHINEKNMHIIAQSDIIINTTSVGMHPCNNDSPLQNSDIFKKNQIVYDVIYNPVKTKLLEMAENNGSTIINGFGMLVFQAIASYEIWNNIKIEDKMSLDLLGSLKKRFNRLGR